MTFVVGGISVYPRRPAIHLTPHHEQDIGPSDDCVGDPPSTPGHWVSQHAKTQGMRAGERAVRHVRRGHGDGHQLGQFNQLLAAWDSITPPPATIAGLWAARSTCAACATDSAPGTTRNAG